MRVDEGMAREVASMMNEAPIQKVSILAKANLEARDHDGAMWRVDFADAENSSAYVSLDTARFLVRRGDTWRTWDFFWMLHNMDYVNRKSFNQPLHRSEERREGKERVSTGKSGMSASS